MTIDEFVVQANHYRLENMSQRYGQALFNYLYLIQPEWANEVRATSIDPFYRDDKVEGFLIFVSSKLEELIANETLAIERDFGVEE